MPHLSLPGPITVIDVETTGLFPGHGDRVIEIAAIRIDPDGSISREFVSLVNPERDVSQSRIHGITATDVVDAPKFSELIPNLVEYLDGTVSIAGHNVSFDYRFLLEEFSRASHPLPELQKLCTMRLFGKKQKLMECCEEMGIEIPKSGLHSALIDCRAAAELLVRLISQDNNLHSAVRRLTPVSIQKTCYQSAKAVSRIEAREAKKSRPFLIPAILANLQDRSESPSPNEGMQTYRGELEKVLADRLITKDELQHLIKVVDNLKLSQEDVVLVHRVLLDDLIDAASRDGVITKYEENDIRFVGETLGFSPEIISESMRVFLAKSPVCVQKVEISSEPVKGNGKSVCFTGEMAAAFQGQPITREIAKKLAENAGYLVLDNVTKKLDILVIADPNSQSGKAKKARQYGVQLIQEAVFWNLIGAGVE
jgi:DNA polymerase-3 subunit epsilon